MVECGMSTISPWTTPQWHEHALLLTDEALATAGRPRTGAATTVKSWGRSCVQTVPTERGTLWIKHSYRLPPGEERVLDRLSKRWPNHVPTVVATWRDAVAMEPLGGEELTAADPVEHWTAAARSIAELQAGEVAHVDDWLELGVRDRRPPQWRPAIEALLESPVVRALDSDLLRAFEQFVPEFIDRYEKAYQFPATLIHQDSGCCNIHVTGCGPHCKTVLFDWSDVVVGHPTFSCDRLLDQVPAEHRDSVIAAFLEPLELSRREHDAMRRSNVLHEVLRYHDELAYLAPADESRAALGKSVQSQIKVLVEYESR